MKRKDVQRVRPKTRARVRHHDTSATPAVCFDFDSKSHQRPSSKEAANGHDVFGSDSRFLPGIFAQCQYVSSRVVLPGRTVAEINDELNTEWTQSHQNDVLSHSR